MKSITPRFLVLFFFFLPLLREAHSAVPRPNILYFYVDDMGWGSIGPNGQAERRAKDLPSVKTPNLDRLAAEGVNFTRAYGATVCSPARSAQQTGYHQGHVFADRNDPDNAKKAMRTNDITMGDALSAAGYVTGYWGKWGYGGTKDQENPEIVNIQTLPTSHGYQHVLAELHHVRAHTFFQPTLWSAPARPDTRGGLELVTNSLATRANPEKYPGHFTHHTAPDYPAPAYCDDSYCFAALDFVRTQATNYRKTGQPFFGLLAVQIPHAPFGEISTLPGWDEAYRDDPHFKNLAPQSRQWAAMVTRIDAHFGLILSALEDPNGDGDPSDSIADDTLVIFMSDNGGPKGKNNDELDANGGLRGNKGAIYEGGIRVPTLMRWPAKITPDTTHLQAGDHCDKVIDVTDLLPTFCELAGVLPPVGIDGVSLVPLLTGNEQGESRRRPFLIHEAGRFASIIRGRHKLIRSGPRKLELFDLESDPAETKDIAAENSELVEELEALMLGERVTEPQGFANTYHHWTGKDGASAADASNWSDYVYENEGIPYLSDTGAPRLSWTARMTNGEGSRSNVARGDSDLEFLSLEIGGNSRSGATQKFALSPGVTLTGRNEIRIGDGGILTLDSSTVSSLRWIDVLEGGELSGTGRVEAKVYNAGTLGVVSGAKNQKAGFRIAGDYVQQTSGHLFVQADGELDSAAFQIDGTARLSGTIELGRKIQTVTPAPGDRFPILKAKAVSGKFDHPFDRVRTADGITFLLQYHTVGVDAVVESVNVSPSS